MDPFLMQQISKLDVYAQYSDLILGQYICSSAVSCAIFLCELIAYSFSLCHV